MQPRMRAGEKPPRAACREKGGGPRQVCVSVVVAQVAVFKCVPVLAPAAEALDVFYPGGGAVAEKIRRFVG